MFHQVTWLCGCDYDIILYSLLSSKKKIRKLNYKRKEKLKRNYKIPKNEKQLSLLWGFLTESTRKTWKSLYYYMIYWLILHITNIRYSKYKL